MQPIIIECRCNCGTKFSNAERASILESFNALPNHEAQNIALRGCVTVINPQQVRRRPRQEDARQRQSFNYAVTVATRTVPVCKAAFCGLHGVKETRLKKKVLNFSDSIQDGRGKHGNHPKVDAEIRTKIREHISQFQPRESHYSRSKNERRSYLDSDLTVAKMHRMFIEEHPDYSTVKDWLYRDIFNYEFNLSFGYPRSDICDKCEKMTADIKAAQAGGDRNKAQQLITEHELHVRKADVFTVQMREDTETAKLAGDADVICLDYEKNLPLPLTGVGQEYYKRQLWLHNLCVHSMVMDHAPYMYLYAEHYAGKGSNDVISCLDHYICHLPETITKLTIFADNCFSQNKNR